MRIVCNGEEREVDRDIRVAELIRTLELDPASIVVACDGDVVIRDEFDSHTLREGSVVELFRFVGGG